MRLSPHFVDLQRRWDAKEAKLTEERTTRANHSGDGSSIRKELIVLEFYLTNLRRMPATGEFSSDSLPLVLWPLAWLISLPFRLLGITFEAVFALLRAILMLPARLLGHRQA